MVADKVMLAYPNFSKPFRFWSDSSDFQLGGTLVQQDSDKKLCPLGFYKRKLNYHNSITMLQKKTSRND